MAWRPSGLGGGWLTGDQGGCGAGDQELAMSAMVRPCCALTGWISFRLAFCVVFVLFVSVVRFFLKACHKS